MGNVEENKEKWKREGGKCGKIEKNEEKRKIRNFTVKKDRKKKLRTFFFSFFSLYTFRKRLKVLRGLP